jgi:hypothetical protein
MKKFWQYTKSKTKTRIGISDLIMNNDNRVETLTNSDKDKANTLTELFSSVFTTETTDKNPSLEGINISYNMGTLVIDVHYQIRYTSSSFCLGFRILSKRFRIILNVFGYFYFLILHCFSS